jgi:hypothetical protein
MQHERRRHVRLRRLLWVAVLAAVVLLSRHDGQTGNDRRGGS